MLVIADESLTKQICPVTQNTSYETTALSFVNYTNRKEVKMTIMSLKMSPVRKVR